MERFRTVDFLSHIGRLAAGVCPCIARVGPRVHGLHRQADCLDIAAIAQVRDGDIAGARETSRASLRLREAAAEELARVRLAPVPGGR